MYNFALWERISFVNGEGLFYYFSDHNVGPCFICGRFLSSIPMVFGQIWTCQPKEAWNRTSTMSSQQSQADAPFLWNGWMHLDTVGWGNTVYFNPFAIL